MTLRQIRVLELRSVVGAGGGPEKTILLGAKLADAQRFRVTVCYLRREGDAAFDVGERAAALGLDYAELVERSSFDLKIWPALRHLVRSREIDIVHAHDYKTNLLALLLARLERVAAVTTAHGWTGHSRRERWCYYPLDKFMMRGFPFVIAVSDQIKSDLLAAGVPADRVHVILNGIDPWAFRRDPSRVAAARKQLGVAREDLVIAAAGRLEPQKRFDLLIRACALVRQRHPSLRLLIAGDGSLRQQLSGLASQVLPNGCSLLGHCRDIKVLHHASDVFVQSSDYEGTPNAVLEAMAMETPIVATSAGGTAQVAEHDTHALIVPPGDVYALATAIGRTLSAPGDAARRAALARRRVESTLSFAHRMAAVDRIYEAALATRMPEGTLAVADRCA